MMNKKSIKILMCENIGFLPDKHLPWTRLVLCTIARVLCLDAFSENHIFHHGFLLADYCIDYFRFVYKFDFES